MNVDPVCFLNANVFQFLLFFFSINLLFYSSTYASIYFSTWIVLEGIIILHVSLS